MRKVKELNVGIIVFSEVLKKYVGKRVSSQLLCSIKTSILNILTQDVKKIVFNYLRKNGYDCLYCRDCECTINSLMPCHKPFSNIINCRPGHIEHETLY